MSASMARADSLEASRRSPAIAAIARYSSICAGEAFSQAVKESRSPGLSPPRLETNQSAASRIIKLRSLCPLSPIDSSQPRHAASAMHQCLTKIFFHHVRRDPKSLSDLLVAQSVPVLEHHRRLAFRG